ncbi:Arachidonate 5-lipoxygenase [Mactra antiquata]
MALRNGYTLCKLFRQEVNYVRNNHFIDRSIQQARYQYHRCCASGTRKYVTATIEHGTIKHPDSHRTFCTTPSEGRSIFAYRNVDYIVDVKTGDQIHAGTDANVYIILHSETEEQTKPIKLDYLFRDDFERGQLDSFQLKNIGHLHDITKLELWRDNSGFASDWFVDYIEIEAIQSRKRFMFPLFRWIKPNRRYIVHHMDNCLPQFDPQPKYRQEEMEMKRSVYECGQKVPGGPSQVRL